MSRDTADHLERIGVGLPYSKLQFQTDECERQTLNQAPQPRIEPWTSGLMPRSTSTLGSTRKKITKLK